MHSLAEQLATDQLLAPRVVKGVDPSSAALRDHVREAVKTKEERSWKVISVDEIIRGYREVVLGVKILWALRGDPALYEQEALAAAQREYDDVLRVHRIDQRSRGEYRYAVIAKNDEPS
ncbi:hypothetical protein HUN08_12435 [Gordonia sp. X0973]|uniref:hypothetical protein n=1 Tax=Gordonia sp. X0973 TaxID=2742602 RepID=UPI000F51D68A|nr:hypothetical protein [Gordonia sp. X0973]QKT07903.1 hypothetical protein HUN08_12435 [Gordonia sp. X0973]